LTDTLVSTRRAAAGGRHLVLYDRDCGFCRWSLAWFLRWDRRRALVPVALQDPLAAELLADLDEVERMASWHLITPAGERISAGSAIAPMLRLLPGGGPPAALLARLPRLAERGYRWVADHRSALGRPVSAAARARADEEIARRHDATLESKVTDEQ
jgi:predicted DCC family thiol-disulfide oxidoreductase YuxK